MQLPRKTQVPAETETNSFPNNRELDGNPARDFFDHPSN